MLHVEFAHVFLSEAACTSVGGSDATLRQRARSLRGLREERGAGHAGPSVSFFFFLLLLILFIAIIFLNMISITVIIIFLLLFWSRAVEVRQA